MAAILYRPQRVNYSLQTFLSLADGNDLVTIWHNSVVQWDFRKVVKSACPMKVHYYPWDYQVCKLIFIPWTYPVYQVSVITQWHELISNEFISNW